eukprot:COSAG02_NODE_6378_length_3611_cov_203.740319_6_plen_345_part_01
MTDCSERSSGGGAAAEGDEAWAYHRSTWWENNSSLRVYFLGSRDGCVRYASTHALPRGGEPWPNAAPGVEDWVLETANEWSKYCSISFVRARSLKAADIIVSFVEGGSSSKIGNASRSCCPSMQLGWVHRDYNAGNRGTVLHEFGHALGLKHEHQHPDAGIPYDEAKVLKLYSGPPHHWSETTIRHNVLNPPNRSHVAGKYDCDSIMHYTVEQKLLKHGHRSPLTKRNTVLSAGDKCFIAEMYPTPDQVAAQEAKAIRWCKRGAFAKQGSKVGEVSMNPDSDSRVKVRWSNGDTSSWIKATALSPASDSDQRTAASWCRKGVPRKYQGKIGTLTMSPDSEAKVKL